LLNKTDSFLISITHVGFSRLWPVAHIEFQTGFSASLRSPRAKIDSNGD
jgi:hypothetical protein